MLGEEPGLLVLVVFCARGSKLPLSGVVISISGRLLSSIEHRIGRQMER